MPEVSKKITVSIADIFDNVAVILMLPADASSTELADAESVTTGADSSSKIVNVCCCSLCSHFHSGTTMDDVQCCFYITSDKL